MKVNFKYKDGHSETIDEVCNLLEIGNGEYCFFIGSGFTRYHALNVEKVEQIEESHEG